MNKITTVVASEILTVAIISILLVYFRSSGMTPAEDLTKRGLGTIRKENIIYFGIMLPMVVGYISFYTYKHWYMAAPSHFFWLAVIIGVAFSILAALFYKKAFYDFTFLHILYITVFGYLMPKLLR